MNSSLIFEGFQLKHIEKFTYSCLKSKTSDIVSETFVQQFFFFAENITDL